MPGTLLLTSPVAEQILSFVRRRCSLADPSTSWFSPRMVWRCFKRFNLNKGCLVFPSRRSRNNVLSTPIQSKCSSLWKRWTMCWKNFFFDGFLSGRRGRTANSTPEYNTLFMVSRHCLLIPIDESFLMRNEQNGGRKRVVVIPPTCWRMRFPCKNAPLHSRDDEGGRSSFLSRATCACQMKAGEKACLANLHYQDWPLSALRLNTFLAVGRWWICSASWGAVPRSQEEARIHQHRSSSPRQTLCWPSDLGYSQGGGRVCGFHFSDIGWRNMKQGWIEWKFQISSNFCRTMKSMKSYLDCWLICTPVGDIPAIPSSYEDRL